MKILTGLNIIILFVLCGCVKEPSSQMNLNKPPKTYLWLFPDTTLADGNSKQHIRWWGDDPDGIIKGYLFTFDTLEIYDSTGRLISPDNMTWRWRTGSDTVIAFPLQKKRQIFYVAVRAVDNSFKTEISDHSLIRFTPTVIYWDRNENDSLDSSDLTLNFPLNSIDPGGATLAMPLLNQPPSVTFAPKPTDQSTVMQQPETTYTAASFAWIGTDPDGDKTITSYRIALNYPENVDNWITIPANKVTVQGSLFGLTGSISIITIYVPRSRSDSVSGEEVVADVYSNKFLNRQKIASLSSLKLDNLNTFYLQAIDIAGDTSKSILQMPPTGKKWYVKKPRSRLLTIIDYISSDSAQAALTYRRALSNVILESTSLADYDELNIGRGITSDEKKNAAAGLSNPKFGALVPAFIDPSLIYTFYLFDYIFWYTDIYPSTPVAQLTLFPYVSTEFEGRKGKVIFSTSFETNPDPRGLLRDFAPIDSISSVVLAGERLLPSLGDSQIPGDYEIFPDSANSPEIYPVLRFNTKFIHSVYLRPLYRRADAQYIYHIQRDERSPVRYAYAQTLNELKSAVISDVFMIVCGENGTILNSQDGGETWTNQKRNGTDFSLNSVRFSDSFNGIVVGDTGSVLVTNNAGFSWQNYSVPTFQNLLGLDFFSDTLAVTVGTNGILLKSVNRGVNWESRPSTTKRTLRSVKFYNHLDGIAVGDTTVLKSTDGGSTWRSIEGIPQRRYNCVTYRDDGTVFAVSSPAYVGGSSFVLRSDNNGENWSQMTIPSSDLRSIYFQSTLNGWIGGKNGRLYRTTDGGGTWEPVATGVTQNINEVIFRNETDGWLSGSGSLILRTENGGLDWTTLPEGNINVGIVDGAKSFIFIGLPLHLLNGNPDPSTDGKLLQSFFEYVFLREFGR